MTREEAIEWMEVKRSTVIEVPDRPQGARELIQAYDMAIEALQAETVKHGKWEKTKVEGGKIYVCSECSEAIYKSTFDENVHYYCNNCGAKMDGGV